MPPTLPELFLQTTSPNPHMRRQAESYLCENITTNPGCTLDILKFATDWGNNQEQLVVDNSSSNIVHSRLAAAIFVKNMIAHSPWGSGAIYSLTPQQIQEKQQQNQNLNNNNNNNAPLSPSQMFGNFLPPPGLQSEIRNQLIIAMVNWKPISSSSSDIRVANTEETILRYIQSAAEAIHDIDWPVNWSGLFEQAVEDFGANALPACFDTLQKLSSNSSGGNNFFSEPAAQQLVQPLTNALNRGAASLCVVKLCCKRLFDPEASDGVLGNNINATISKNRGTGGKSNSSYKNEASEELLRLSQTLLQPLGEAVLVPFIKVINNPDWSRLLIHSSEFLQQQQGQQQEQVLLLQNLERAWTTFCYEGLKAIYHLAQTQVYGALLEAKVDGQQPFLFALVQSCCKLHHALISRLLMRRERIVLSQQENNSNNNKSALYPQSLFFCGENDKREAQVWRLWKRVWAVLYHLFDHYGEQQAVPKSIRKTHRDWIREQFVPALGCALGMVALHENRPGWAVSKFVDRDSDFSFSSLNAACERPGVYSVQIIFSSFVRACAAEASSNNDNQNHLLLCPFLGAPFRADSSAANFTADVLELSFKFLPWLWWENVLIPQDTFYENILLISQGKFSQAIEPLFRAPQQGFTDSIGVLAWPLIRWVILPRQAITVDEIDEWNNNPDEYLNSKNDANTELYNLKSSYSRVLSAMLIAKDTSGDTGKKNNKHNKKQQHSSNNNTNNTNVSVAKLRVQLLVDTSFQLLATSSNTIFNENVRDMSDPLNPHPAILGADAALQIVRLCRHAVMERGAPPKNNKNKNNNNNNNNLPPNEVESGLMMQGLHPLLSAKNLRFGPLRAKAAQVVSELCSGIQWSGEEAFQTLLKDVLDLMYDNDVAVRMQVCSCLSPIIRHPLAGTVVVPHLVKIVQQFFDVLAQNQNDIVIRTLRKLFAHYREHMGQWAVDLSKIIQSRFEETVFKLLELEKEDEQNNNQNVRSGKNNNNNNQREQRQAQDEFEREVTDLTTVADELLGAISTIVKCVPRPSTININTNPDARRAVCNTACDLQSQLSPMLQHMFDSSNSFGFFEGGLKLLSVLLRRSEDRVLPVTWNIFTSMFKVICIRNATDCFSNMIAVLDNFVSCDPASFMMHRPTTTTSNNDNNSNNNNNNNNNHHPAERATFAFQACEMLRCVCQNASIPIQDVANAIQCIDCFVLNGARCLQNSIVARFAPQNTIVKDFSFDQICAAAESNDPLHLREFLELPVILTQARQQRLPQEAARMSLLATPSLCVLLANSIFCCILAATPQAVATESVVLQRALLSFSLTSRLFETFNGQGSGEYRRVTELAQQPLHFRTYDRKLFILALSHFIASLVQSPDQQQQECFFNMMRQEGYVNNNQQQQNEDRDLISTLEGFLKTALMMATENAYVDCRMLLSLRNEAGEMKNEFFQNENGGGGMSDDDDGFSEDGDEFGDGDSDEDTDVTTDEDFLEGVYDDDDFDNDDDEDDDGYIDDDGFGGGDDNNMGGVSKHSYINQLASEAARAREQFDAQDDELEEDDFHDNLLVENPNQKITTPIDDIDEFRVLGEVLENVLSSSGQNDNRIRSLVVSAINKLASDFGGIPVCRQKNPNNNESKKARKKKLQQQAQQQQQQKIEFSFALASFYTKTPPTDGSASVPSLAVPEFLRQCSQQKSAIENFE